MRAPQTSSADSDKPPRSALALAILVALTALALSPALFADYIRLDDYRHILENPNLRTVSPRGLAAFWAKPYFGLYIPVTYSVWWVVAAVGHAAGTLKQNAWLFHALNLVFHLVNAALVFLVVRTLLRAGRDKLPALGESASRTVSLLAALCFSLHPLQVESVAWVSEFKGLLSATLGLLGTWRYYRSPKKVLTATLFVAAVLAKPSAIVFPGVLLIVDRILLGKGLKESAKAPALLALLLLPLVFVTKLLQPNLNLDFVPSVSQRFAVAADAFAFYLRKLVFPFPLALDYGRSPRYVLDHVHGGQTALFALLFLAGVAAAVYALARPRRSQSAPGWRALLACGWAIFLWSIVPVLGLIPFEFQDFSTVADHYLYVAIFGASLMVAAILVRFRASAKSTGLSIAVVFVFAGLSFQQARLWRSTESLFGHTLTVNPRSYLSYYSIAAELMEAGKVDQAIAENARSLAINPDYLYADVALGVGLIQKGNYQGAVDHYLSVLAKSPSFAGKRAPLVASIHNNLGMALHQIGRDAEGTAHFRRAVEVDPQSVNGHMNLGNAAFNDKRYLDAIPEYEIALVLSPGNPEIEHQLGLARRGARTLLLGGRSP